MTAIKKNLGNFAAIIGLIIVAAGVSLYILDQQRLRIPFFEPKPYQLKAEFSTAQAVVAGQGQTVRVSGVRIGDIGGVELKNGRAVIKMDLDQEYKDLVHTNATALLRPKTGLKDMFIDLQPGGGDAPVAKRGFTIPIRATQPDVNPDEVLSVLDTDTREYLQLLVNGLGRGLEGRGGDLRDLFARFEPTHRDLARVNGAVATRRKQLRHLVTSLNVLSKELASQRRRPRQARRLLLGGVRLVRQGAGQRLLRRAASCRARWSRPPTRSGASRRSPSCSARRPRSCARRRARSPPPTRPCARSPARRPRSCARASGRSSASRARSCATCAPSRRGSRRPART